jgi:hypothetical protein
LKSCGPGSRNRCPVVADRNERAGSRIRLDSSENEADDEGTTTGGPHAARLAIAVLAEAGAIRECEEHGWVQDRADPHARERASREIPREEPPPDFSRRRRRRLPSPKCWIRSETPVRSVRPNKLPPLRCHGRSLLGPIRPGRSTHVFFEPAEQRFGVQAEVIVGVDTCQRRTGRHEEDGCWPALEKPH